MPDSPRDPLLRNSMLAEYEEVFGPCEVTWGLRRKHIPLDIHLFGPDPKTGIQTLVTTGMAAKPMTVPKECVNPDPWHYGELALQLPKNWRLDDEALQDKRHSWPFNALADAAEYPHRNDTWIWWGHTIGETPLHPSTKLSSTLILPAPPEFECLSPVKLLDGREVHVMFLAFLYPAEREYKVKHGLEALEEKFIEAGIAPRDLTLFNPKRHIALKPRRWPF